jgi:hypothetical protein
MQVSDDRFQAESGWNSMEFHPGCLEAVIRNLHEAYQCQMYSRKLLMMGREFHPDSAWKRSSETCMKLTSAKCTVENS